MGFASSSKLNLCLCFLLLPGSCPTVYLQIPASSHLVLRKEDTILSVPLLVMFSTALNFWQNWYKPVLYPSLPRWHKSAAAAAASSYNSCTFLLGSQIYLSTGLWVLFIHIQLLNFILFLQSRSLPLFWKCSFHLLNSFTYPSGWLLFINVNLTAFTETWKCFLNYYTIFKCK